MNPREKALNKLINFDNGYGAHSINPRKLKIDFFEGYWFYYLELGVAYLDGRIDKKYIPSMMHDRLKNIEELISNDILKIKEIKVEISGIEGESFSKSLNFCK